MTNNKYGPKGIRPSGRIMAHNHIRRSAGMPHGVNGFRRWYDWPPRFQQEILAFRRRVA